MNTTARIARATELRDADNATLDTQLNDHGISVPDWYRGRLAAERTFSAALLTILQSVVEGS